MQLQLEQRDRELDKYKHDTELQFKYFKELVESQDENAKIDAQLAMSQAQEVQGTRSGPRND